MADLSLARPRVQPSIRETPATSHHVQALEEFETVEELFQSLES